MPTHVVKQGECFATIAQANGVSADALYQHPDNADLRKKRPNSNILYPGDEVVVPDHKTKEATVPTGTTHRFRVKVPRYALRLILLDGERTPVAGESYVLEANGKRSE